MIECGAASPFRKQRVYYLAAAMRVEILTAAVAAAVAFLPMTPQGQGQTFRASVHTVPLYPLVSGADGRLVTNLTRDDFIVLDNGKPAEVTVFSSETQPMTAALLLDMSSSMDDHLTRVRVERSRFDSASLTILEQSQLVNSYFSKLGWGDGTFLCSQCEIDRSYIVDLRLFGGATILDVREKADFGAGFVPGSINIGLKGSFATWCGTLLPVDRPLLLVADAKNEAADIEEARMRLARVGLHQVAGFLAGGVIAWRKAGLPLVTLKQMVTALVAAVETLPAGGVRIVDVPAIVRAALN